MTLMKTNGAVRVISDPELKFSQSGMAIASFRGVTDQKKKNQATGEWEDDKVMFVRVTAFKDLAEHVAASLKKGDTAIVSGSIYASEWETKEGEKRTTVEINADEIGTSLRWGNTTFEKAERSAPQQQSSPWPDKQNDGEPPF